MSDVLDRVGTAVLTYEEAVLADEVDRKVKEAAGFLRAHAYPTAPSWGYDEARGLWILAHREGREPEVALAIKQLLNRRWVGYLRVGWTSRKCVHTVSGSELVREFGAAGAQRVLDGIQHLFSLQHPEVVCID